MYFTFSNKSVKYKDEPITFQIKDYQPLKKEAFTKAAAAHYDFAVKTIESSAVYSERKKAFKHFDESIHYDKEDKYKSTIPDFKAVVYYEEGVNLLKGKTFKEKKQSIFYLKKATEFVPNYKDSKEQISKVYYDYATILSASENYKDWQQAHFYFGKCNEGIENYNDCNASKADLEPKIADVYYQQAETKFEEETFVAANGASKLYETAEKWSPDFKDAKQKAAAAKSSCEINVIIVKKDGKLLPPQSLSYELQSGTENYIFTPNVSADLKDLDMNNVDNYEKAKEIIGYGFVVIKMLDDGDEVDYTTDGPTTKSEEIVKYYSVKTEDGKTTEKVISESDYKTKKKIIEMSGGVKQPYKLYKYKGTLTTTKETSSIKFTTNVEILDARDLSSIDEVITLKGVKSVYDVVMQQKYSGDKKITPKLRMDERDLKSEEELSAGASTISVKSIVKANMDKIAKTLNKNLEYKAIN